LRQRDAVAQQNNQRHANQVSQSERNVHDNLLPIRRYGGDAPADIRQSE
jgi:hypothetical protein